MWGINIHNELQYVPVPSLEGRTIVPSDFPHLLSGAQALLGLPAAVSFATAKHRKTTTGGYEIPVPEYRIEKTGGFKFSSTEEEVREERARGEFKRALLRAGIDIHKLWLLINTAYHNQVLLERYQVKKDRGIIAALVKSRGGDESRKLDKTGGRFSSNEVALAAKQKRRNERALRQYTNVYSYK